ncbi:alpha/beta hydrolase-fold protein [Actinokineospora soli]
MGGIALLGACGKPGAAAPLTPAAPPADPALTVTPRTVETPSVSELVYRSGSAGDVKLVVMRPREVSGVLPVCLAFHGHGRSARQFVELGVPSLLTATDRAGTPPFAVAAVDGKDWGPDAMRVVADELPGWLTTAGVAASPFAVMGISTGAVAALEYAREPGPTVVAAVSPAVFRDWDSAALFGLADEARWAATDPLRAPANVKTAVWCGEDDDLAPAVRDLVAHTGAEAFFAPGAGHDDAYWTSVMPAVLKHVGRVIG